MGQITSQAPNEKNDGAAAAHRRRSRLAQQLHRRRRRTIARSKHRLATVSASLLLTGAVIGSAIDYLSLPVMLVDAATGECVAIQAASDRHGCANPPTRYTRQVIAPVPQRESYRDPQATESPAEIARRRESDRFWEEQRAYLASLPPGAAGKEGEPVQPTPRPAPPTDLQVERIVATAEPAPGSELSPAADDAGGDDTQLAAAPATAGPVFTFTHPGGRPAAHHHHTTPVAVPEPNSAMLLVAAGALVFIRRMLP